MNYRVQGKQVLFSSLFTLLSLFSLSPTIYSTSINPKIVSGIYSEDLPSPVFYETYISVVLEYVTPKFKPVDITFNNWYNCTSEKYPYTLSCPVVFHLNNAIKNFHIDFESIQPGKNDEDYEKSPYFDRLLSSSDFCHKIQTHFPDIYTNAGDLEKYLNALKQCSIQELFLKESMDIFGSVNNGNGKERIYIERDITDFSYNVRSPYSKMETNFYDSFYKPVANASAGNESIRKLASATLSNSRTALQGSLLSSFYAERNRWMHAISSCHSHRLPQSLVNDTRLRSILSNLSLSSGGSQYYNFSIPIESISSYFSLPLTDCTHTADSFVVRLLVPLISAISMKENTSPFTALSLRLVRNIPFLLNQQKICTVKGIEDRSTFLTMGGAAYETKCQPNELCDISLSTLSSSTTSPGSGSGGNLCMSLIYANKIQEFVQNCDLECRNPLIIRPPFPPIFIHRSSNKSFVLMGTESFQVTCQFSDKQSETFDFSLKELALGAVEITFNCNCELFLPSPPNFHGMKESNADRGRNKFGQAFRSGNLNECQDSNRPFYEIVQIIPWHVLTQEKQLECLSDIQKKLDGRDEEERFLTASPTSDYEPIDLEILSGNVNHILDFDIINRLVSSNSSDYEQRPHTAKTFYEGTIKTENDSGFSWTLFMLFFIIAILCIGQVLLFYQMNQLRETPYFSLPNRVLYRTTTTPALIEEENE